MKDVEQPVFTSILLLRRVETILLKDERWRKADYARIVSYCVNDKLFWSEKDDELLQTIMSGNILAKKIQCPERRLKPEML